MHTNAPRKYPQRKYPVEEPTLGYAKTFGRGNLLTRNLAGLFMAILMVFGVAAPVQAEGYVNETREKTGYWGVLFSNSANSTATSAAVVCEAIGKSMTIFTWWHGVFSGTRPNATYYAGYEALDCLFRDSETGITAVQNAVYPMTRAVCPANSTPSMPCTCNTGYKPDPARTSCIPIAQTTIALHELNTGGELYVSTTRNTAYVQVMEGGTPKSGIAVTLTSSAAAPATGTLMLSPTQGSTNAEGKLNFSMTAPAIAGTHTITATCDGGKCSAPATGTITVIPEPLTLELDPALKGDPTLAIEPDQSHATYVRVTSTRTKEPKAGVEVRVRVDVTANSGGHSHHTDRPKGTLTGTACSPPEQGCVTLTTGADGKAGFNFNAPIVSGTHTFSAACVKPTCTNEDSGGQIEVKVPGLVQIPDSLFYSLQLPNRDTNHPSTHYLTPEATSALWHIAASYRLESGFRVGGVAPPPLSLNDASLKWGGVLDCFLTCGTSVAWGPSHHEHRQGSVIDIRANGAEGSIPTNKKMTKKFESRVQALIRLRYPNTPSSVPIAKIHGSGSGRHFHVQLLGRKQ